MEEFEMELQELFNEVKSMVKIGKESDAMDLLRANYVAVKEELDSGLKGIEQAAVLDIIALGYMAVGDLKPVPALLDMVSLKPGIGKNHCFNWIVLYLSKTVS
jgi:hypothetical protein